MSWGPGQFFRLEHWSCYPMPEEVRCRTHDWNLEVEIVTERAGWQELWASLEARPTVKLQVESWAKNNPASLRSFLPGSHWSPALTESSWKPSVGQHRLISQGSEKGGPRSGRMNRRYPPHWCISRLRFLHFPSLQPSQRIHLRLISHTRIQNNIEQQPWKEWVDVLRKA